MRDGQSSMLSAELQGAYAQTNHILADLRYLGDQKERIMVLLKSVKKG